MKFIFKYRKILLTQLSINLIINYRASHQADMKF